MKKYYTTYETTNIVNNKYYLGVHKTKNISDGYLGSGKLIKKAIIKYGDDAFDKIITGVWRSEEIMYLMEKWVITEDEVNNPMCYNLREGGTGGWGHLSKDEILSASLKGAKAMKVLYPHSGNCKGRVVSDKERLSRSKVWTNDLKKSVSDKVKNQYKNGRVNSQQGKTGILSATGQIVDVFDSLDNLVHTFSGDFSTVGRETLPSWSGLRSSKMFYNKTGEIKRLHYKEKQHTHLFQYNGWYCKTR